MYSHPKKSDIWALREAWWEAISLFVKAPTHHTSLILSLTRSSQRMGAESHPLGPSQHRGRTRETSIKLKRIPFHWSLNNQPNQTVLQPSGHFLWCKSDLILEPVGQTPLGSTNYSLRVTSSLHLFLYSPATENGLYISLWILCSEFIFFQIFYLFIWLHRVFVVACGIFSWGMQTLS